MSAIVVVGLFLVAVAIVITAMVVLDAHVEQKAYRKRHGLK